MAGGSFTDGGGHVQGFVDNQRHGRWQRAEEVPGLGALNVAGDAVVTSVRCAADGDCAAGGSYQISIGNPNYLPGTFQPFVVSEHDGVWSAALEVPGIQAVNSGEDAGLTSLSCPSAGNCTAAGNYYDNNQDGPYPHPWR